MTAHQFVPTVNEVELQWGHGAWPWMTLPFHLNERNFDTASMGPRRMAVDDRR